MNVEKNIEPDKFQTGGVTIVSTAHSVHDTYTAFLPPLLPVLIEKFSLTNTSAGLLSVFLQIPSLLQPFIGQLADRTNLRLLIILTPAITGAGMSLLSIAPTYGFLIFLLVFAGLSSASLHAVGPVLSGTFAGKKLGRGMSFWMVGGEFGRAFGPIVVVTAIGFLTLEGLPWLMLAGILTSIFLYTKLQSITTQPRNNGNHIPWKTALVKMRPVMTPLVLLIFARSLMIVTITTYMPTFLTSEGSSLWVAGASLSILQAAGVVGAFLAGSLSDTFGRRRMLVISFITTPIFMLLFLQTKGLLQVPLLILIGFFGISITPVLMAIVLENFPNNRSFANGIYMLFSFVLMALATLIIGALADLINLRFTFTLSAVLVLFGIPFIRMLPKSQKLK
ncbi:MAG TPA: MFS transporter [Anaerolineaceae bacterium]|nr:MFS transporter [Anaerolineaceae bacterium]